jgi:hypothetical protein
VGSGGADHVAQRGELRTAAGDRLVARIDGATDKWVTRMPRVDPDAGLGSGVPTLRDRLPVDLREAACGPDFEALPFTPLYLLDDEWATEIANRTTHGVMHPGWAPDGTGATAASWPSS